MAKSKRTAEAGRDGSAPRTHPSPGHEPSTGGAPVCTVGFCPICLAVTAMQPLRPDAIEHLLAAGKEFLLAARAIIDARAEGFEGDRRASHMEKIDIG